MFNELKVRMTGKKSQDVLYNLLCDYLNIQESGVIPEVSTASKHFQEALLNKDYEAALKFKLKLGEGPQYNTTLMLIKIVKLIRRLKKVQEEIEKNRINLIHSALLSGSHEQAISDIHEYLAKYNFSKYEFLVISLIKISILEGDSTFIRPVNTLRSIINNDFKFDALKYRKDFYDSLEGNYLEEAKTYLDIINYMSGIYYLPFNTNKLTFDLEKAQKDQVKEHLSSLISSLSDKILQDKRPIFLKNLTPDEKEFIKNYFGDDSCILAQDFGDKLFIKYYNHMHVDMVALNKSAQNYYDNHSYKACLDTCFKNLSLTRDSKDFILALIGRCYWSLGNYDLAISYLEVAYFQKNDAYYLKLIAKLKENQTKNSQEISFSLTDFRTNNLTNFPDIKASLTAVLTNNISLRDALDAKPMPSFEINILKLFLAREYYIKGISDVASKLLIEVEKSSAKTKELTSIITEIRKNIKFYALGESNLMRILRKEETNDN